MDTQLPRIDTDNPLLWKRVYDTLEGHIVHRRIAPGTHLAEVDLAQQLGVSRSPVREALRALQQEGWVELRPRQGTFVRQPSPEEARDLFEARGELEPYVAGLAARRANDEVIQELQSVLDRGMKAAEKGDMEEIVALNSHFHAAIRTAAGNVIFESLLDRLDKLVRWYFSPVATVRGVYSWDEHGELLEAISRRDVVTASGVMRRHVQATERAFNDSAAHHLEGVESA